MKPWYEVVSNYTTEGFMLGFRSKQVFSNTVMPLSLPQTFILLTPVGQFVTYSRLTLLIKNINSPLSLYNKHPLCINRHHTHTHICAVERRQVTEVYIKRLTQHVKFDRICHPQSSRALVVTGASSSSIAPFLAANRFAKWGKFRG